MNRTSFKMRRGGAARATGGMRRWLRASALCLGMIGCAGAKDGAPADTVRSSAAGDSLAPANRATAANDGAPPVTILFLGTSLTAGQGVELDDAYPAVLGRMLDSAGFPVTVLNSGQSGETSAGALRRLDWPLSSADIDILVVETGANDGLRGLDLDSTRANIATILDRARERRPKARLLLVQMESPPNMGERYTRSFRGLFPQVAREKGIALAPFLLEGVAGIDSLNQGDGIHPNEAGAKIAARNLYPAVLRLVREISG